MGRFLNADALVSTGQGVLGNNMFAYCGNSPISRSDPTGNAFVQIGFNYTDTSDLLFPTLGGSGGGAGYAFSAASSGANTIREWKKFVSNESEATTQWQLRTYGIGFYKGTPVFAVDWMGNSALSFGIILMGSENLEDVDFADTLNHEYGHTVHLSMVGPVDYFITTAIPSLTFAGLTNSGKFPHEYYYDLPWERTADYLGGVERQYLPSTNRIASVFWLWTLRHASMTPI